MSFSPLEKGRRLRRSRHVLAIEDVTGSFGDNVIFGNGAFDTLRGLAGNDTIRGGAGGDYLDGGGGFDLLDYKDSEPA